MEKNNELEQALLIGIHGEPEFKRDERIYFLGEFKERIIKRLSISQVKEEVMYDEIRQALKDEKAVKLILNGNINSAAAGKYRELAIKMNKQYTVRSDSEFKGDTGLLVASSEAVSEGDIDVEERTLRLRRLGMPLLLIESAGKKVCDQCLHTIANIDENELKNYEELTWLDRFSGDTCPAHQGEE